MRFLLFLLPLTGCPSTAQWDACETFCTQHGAKSGYPNTKPGLITCTCTWEAGVAAIPVHSEECP